MRDKTTEEKIKIAMEEVNAHISGEIDLPLAKDIMF